MTKDAKIGVGSVVRVKGQRFSPQLTIVEYNECIDQVRCVYWHEEFKRFEEITLSLRSLTL